MDQSGQPKVLDFGVARATDSDIQQTTVQTDIGAIVGTVPYMSPEQVSGDPDDLDTRSDVYALGVIAYELLSGRRPYDLERKMIHEAARIIREEEPTRLSSINRTLRGDVETIVAKALEKEKTRRYQSAESLASDIRRYLKDEPIAARPASTWYQLSKFSRRNKGLVAGVAVAFLALTLGLAGTVWKAIEAQQERDFAKAETLRANDRAVAAARAEEAARAAETVQRRLAQSESEQRRTAETQRDKAEKIAEFMSDTLQGAGPSVALGRDITMLKEMMDAAAARIEKGDLKDAPEAELRLRGTIGGTYRDLAQFELALRMIEPSVPLARSLYDGDHEELATILNIFGRLRTNMGPVAEAEPLLTEALEMRQRLYPGDHVLVAQSCNNLGRTFELLGRFDDAERMYDHALAMWRRIFPGDNRDVASSLNNLAGLRMSLGREAEAEPLYEQALEMRRRLFPGDHPEVAQSLNNLALLRESRGRAAEAEPLCEQSLQMNRRLFPSDHPEVAMSLNNLAYVRESLGRAAEAEPLFEQAMEMRRRLFKGDHPHVAMSLNNLAWVRQSLGRAAEAEPLYREAVEMSTRLVGKEHPSTLTFVYNLADLLITSGRHAEAAPLVEECVAGNTKTFGAAHRDTRDALRRAVRLYESWDKAEPGKGYDVKAAEWKAKLDALPASAAPPTSAEPSAPK